MTGLLMKIFSLGSLATIFSSWLCFREKDDKSWDFYYRETGEESKEVNLLENLSSKNVI